MELDIIEYTEGQLAVLSAGQIQQVITAQKKKNELLANLPKKLSKLKAELIGNGTFHSDLWQLKKEEMALVTEQEIEMLREGLLTYLHYAVKPKDEEIVSAPYEVDYSLSVAERYQQVKEYYESDYEDAQLRFEAFQNDEVAEKYLGELYYTLYDYFYMQANP